MKNNYLLSCVRCIFVGGFALLLTGCVGMNSDFDCKLAPGIHCKSLGEINRMVDQGKLGKTDEASKVTSQRSGCLSGHCQRFSASEPEEISRVWIAPYTDAVGNHHSATTWYSARTSLS